MKNKVQLITYVNRFGGGGLPELQALLTGPLKDVFGAVHILPFFLPIDGADAGFDPIDHRLVDPKAGCWNDVKSLSQDIDVMADVIVNHMSAESEQFRDVLERGSQSPFDKLFLTQEDVFPRGATPQELAAVYRPRPGVPFTPMTLRTGETRQFWTTFTPQQLDINVERPEGIAYLDGILQQFRAAGIRMIRLDAVGYAIKRAGTSCFMLPETFAFIDRLTARARELGMEVLVEVHSYYRQQVEVAKMVDWVYDFALPPLLLHAFAFGTAKCLAEWVKVRPSNALTVLDTHDGIGIIDIGADASDRKGRPGLVPPEQLAELVEIIHQRTKGESRQATGAAASNLDLYQVNSTFFDAMGRDVERYLLARAVQFFLPGVPQVYYVGLMCGANDMALLHETGVGRDINRHYYSLGEVELHLQSSPVQRLLQLIRLRNSHPAFDGALQMDLPHENVLSLIWRKDTAFAELSVDFAAGSGALRYSDGDAISELRFRADDVVQG
ncbi:sucrose phosphorylase [Rhizomicrobium palustre]|uniref:Sucrose phosphorylase n=1 Tax=Rhizomicrobium palustre TaxID=189966 RepID=A0A846MUS8_9PROT|nr:sucrose phosphorylase [Rhizomicrobium palustre]NIK86767.1 sucrose phosphorylase [Rhizomicrobium palustre]